MRLRNGILRSDLARSKTSCTKLTRIRPRVSTFVSAVRSERKPSTSLFFSLHAPSHTRGTVVSKKSLQISEFQWCSQRSNQISIPPFLRDPSHLPYPSQPSLLQASLRPLEQLQPRRRPPRPIPTPLAPHMPDPTSTKLLFPWIVSTLPAIPR